MPEGVVRGDEFAGAPKVYGYPGVAPVTKKISKISSLVYLLYKVTIHRYGGLLRNSSNRCLLRSRWGPREMAPFLLPENAGWGAMLTDRRPVCFF
jgi:hypothetical protein